MNKNQSYPSKSAVFSRLSVKMFLLILVCVVLPLYGICFYVRNYMEDVIRKSLSERITQNIARNESYICDALQRMSFLSNSFIYDEEFSGHISDEAYSWYENAERFNKILEKLYLNGGYDRNENIKIAVFDKYGRMYSNWSQNYENYEFLLEADWVKESKEQNGHAVWAMFSPAYIPDSGDSAKKYISLARSILSEGTYGDYIGTIIISIDQEDFGKILMEYAYDGDFAYVCIDNGEMLMTNDEAGAIGTRIHRIYGETREQKSGSLQKQVNGKEYLISYYTLPKPWVFDGQQMKIFHFTEYEEVSRQIRAMTGKINAVLGAALVLVLFLSWMVTRILVSPIERLTHEMEKFSIDSEITGIDTERRDEIGRLNRTFCHMAENIRGLFARLHEEHEIKERYRFESLRAQLNPHFLFNTLTSIRFMAIIRGADNIVESIDTLANMLKYTMNRDGNMVTVRKEIENIQNYVYIQNCRYGEHYRLEVRVPEELLELPTMKFILQPIVENAVIHGLDKEKNEIRILVTGYSREEKLFLVVEDDGVGMTGERVERLMQGNDRREKERKLTGIGIANVDECIRISFGKEYGLTVESEAGRGTRVTFCLPVLKGEECEDEKGTDR